MELVEIDASTVQEELSAALAEGTAPDLLAGSHLWGDFLLDTGFSAAYCLPDGCPECDGPDKPQWCKFAAGDFSWGTNSDFLINGLCIGCDCPCVGPNQPFWCRLAEQEFERQPDVFQGSFAHMIDDYPYPFPHGIPGWWDFVVIAANPSRLEELGLEPPTRLEEVVNIAREFGGVYVGDPSPDPMLADQIGQELYEIAVAGDPSPQPNVSILILRSDQFRQVQNEVGELMPLRLEDYRPALHVQGLYMNAQTEQRSQALDLMYALADEEVQYMLFERTGHLPTHSEILAQLSDEVVGPLIEVGKTGILAGP